MNDKIISSRLCWVETKALFILIIGFLLLIIGYKFIIALYFNNFTLVIEELQHAYILYLVLLSILIGILFRIKRGHFYLDRFEFTYPFRFWDKKVYQLLWTDIKDAKTRKPWRESRRMRMKFKNYNIAFKCTWEEVIALQKALNISVDLGHKWNQGDK